MGVRKWANNFPAPWGRARMAGAAWRRRNQPVWRSGLVTAFHVSGSCSAGTRTPFAGPMNGKGWPLCMVCILHADGCVRASASGGSKREERHGSCGDDDTSRADGASAYFDEGKLQEDLARRSLRGGAISITARAANAVVQVASVLVLARLLTPEDYGLVAMVTAPSSPPGCPYIGGNKSPWCRGFCPV